MYLRNDLHELPLTYTDFSWHQVKIVNKSSNWFVTLIFDLKMVQNQFLTLAGAGLILVSKIRTLRRFQKLHQLDFKSR